MIPDDHFNVCIDMYMYIREELKLTYKYNTVRDVLGDLTYVRH